MKKLKKKKERNQSVDKSKPKDSSRDESDSEDKFDFGGLPRRDLKKNLGCG